MKQRDLRVSLVGMLGDLDGVYHPDADVRESIVDWLLDVARAAAFGEKAAALDRDGAACAVSTLEAIVRVPLQLEARLRHARSTAHYPVPDFVCEFYNRDGKHVAEGAATLLSVAITHAARTLARA